MAADCGQHCAMFVWLAPGWIIPAMVGGTSRFAGGAGWLQPVGAMDASSAWLVDLIKVMSRSMESASAGVGQALTTGTYGTVAEAVRQVGADRGQDARTEAPARKGWYRLVAPVGVEYEHAG
jgi:hypothetical protein